MAAAIRGRPTFAVASAAVLVLALVLLAPSAHATTYKWIDDKGVVHYTDKIPPEAINKGNVELDKQGVPVRKTDPALSPEQRKARAEEDARRQQLAKERALVERRDRALLGTYTTEGEIDLARTRAVSTIDAQVQSSTAYVASLSKRKLELESRKAALGDKPVPQVLERELANINTELGKAGRPHHGQAERDRDGHRALRRGQEALEGIARGGCRCRDERRAERHADHRAPVAAIAEQAKGGRRGRLFIATSARLR